MIEINNKEECCGCTACFSVCPRSCISMQVDDEGFLYPLVDNNQCINCGACDKICPIKNNVKEEITEQQAFLLQHKNENIRRESTAGGAYTAIARYILDRGGVVFGAAYDENFQVQHTYVESFEELCIFRNSKYVESRLGNSFKQVKQFIREGRWVCFSGTPCQIEGLVKFFGKKPGKLVLVDVVCHAVPSPLIWNKYLEYQKDKVKNATNILFRDKIPYGYKYSTMTIHQGEKDVYCYGVETDPMLRAFFSDLSVRPSCYKCHFKKRYRVSDFTIWDCFSVYNFNKNMDDDKGTTRVLVHSEQGRKIIREIITWANLYEVDADKLVRGVKEMNESVSMNPKRKEFFSDANRMSGAELCEKYFPITTKTKVKRSLRIILVKTGIYSLLKKCVNRVKGR